MKNKLIICCLILFTVVLANWNCSTPAPKEENKTEQSSQITDKLNGAWQTVSLTTNGNLSINKQVKFFSNGFFNLVAWDTAGKIAFTGYGKYELEGNSYHETFLYHNNPAYVGGQDWQSFELNGDTLIMTGFNKVIIGGKEVTADFPKIVEKRIKLK